jgi:hypothetical protein
MKYQQYWLGELPYGVFMYPEGERAYVPSPIGNIEVYPGDYIIYEDGGRIVPMRRALFEHVYGAHPS